ncbi:MAG TPA: N,N-dimethylformamidase beta subunit family domain-containing protein [Candidatus Deferrimicrobium sp.]|nr:N,N-dimethylformamidase beta subunit family domain-containing protein [Candidatus Deferrimicrobium sp.]
MDRRQFLVVAGRFALGAGLASVSAACAEHLRAIEPPSSRTPAPRTSAPTEGRAASPSSSAPPSSRAPIGSHDDSIARENRRRGSHGWDLRGVGAVPAADGFVDRASAAPGDTLNLHLRSATASTIEWYRLGWYGGAGARLVRVDRDVAPTSAAPTIVDPVSGMAEAPYPVAISLEVPGNWPSGVYLAVIRPRVGAPGCVPFTVRPPSVVGTVASAAPVLYVSAAATWQAYNPWGGADFYDASKVDTPEAARGRRAVQVSFDRPHLLRHGAGYLPRWELPFIRWQERQGRAVEYCADIDLELHPELVTGRRLIVFAGHHEYWSRPMRTTLEAAIGSGSNVAFLSANEIYWQVRLEPSPLGPARRITCWKSRVDDPLATSRPDLTTCRWREEPVGDPEAVVVGQMYGHVVRRPADWVVAGAGHWLYEGTRLQDGDRIANLVGQEYDTFFPEYARSGTTILARSPVSAVVRGKPVGGGPADPSVHTATIYTADSGATVLAAGTFQWSWAIDGYGDRSYLGVATPLDARVARMTANLFDRLGDGPLEV